MHIAVCDDNVADRKQFERLVKRESERFKGTEDVLFANLFGNANALLANPMQYDAFYIDMCNTPGTSVEEIVNTLVQKGVKVPIILCCSNIDYRTLTLPGDISYLDKPIHQDDLSRTLDYALEVKRNSVPVIELRDTKGTYYMTEPDIMYAIQEGDFVDIFLKDGRTIHTMDTAMNLFHQWESFPVFMAPNLKTVINCRYIKSFKFRNAIMVDDKSFKVAKECMQYAKTYAKKCAEEQA